MGCRSSKAAGADEFAVKYAVKNETEPVGKEPVVLREVDELSETAAVEEDKNPRFFDTNLAFANTVWKTAVEKREVYAREDVEQTRKRPQAVAKAPEPTEQELKVSANSSGKSKPVAQEADRSNSSGSEISEQDTARYRPDFFKTRLSTANFAWTGAAPHGAPEELAGAATSENGIRLRNPFAAQLIAATQKPAQQKAAVQEPVAAAIASAISKPAKPAQPGPGPVPRSIADAAASYNKAAPPSNKLAPQPLQSKLASTVMAPPPSKQGVSQSLGTAVAAAAPQSKQGMGPSMKQLRAQENGGTLPSSVAPSSMVPTSLPSLKPQTQSAPSAGIVSPFAAASQQPFGSSGQPKTAAVGGRSNPFANSGW